MSLSLDMHEKEVRRFMGTPSHQTRKNGGESGASLGEGVGVGVGVERKERKSAREPACSASPGDAQVALLEEGCRKHQRHGKG